MVDVDVQHVMYNPNQTDKYKESKRDRLRRKEVASLLLNLSHLTAASIQPLYPREHIMLSGVKSTRVE